MSERSICSIKLFRAFVEQATNRTPGISRYGEKDTEEGSIAVERFHFVLEEPVRRKDHVQGFSFFLLFRALKVALELAEVNHALPWSPGSGSYGGRRRRGTRALQRFLLCMSD